MFTSVFRAGKLATRVAVELAADPHALASAKLDLHALLVRTSSRSCGRRRLLADLDWDQGCPAGSSRPFSYCRFQLNTRFAFTSS
ncbi:MAG TPA: hypothetical protein VHK24_12810 [Steroidobacter sp.]|nr:hypothetical protein [Steroidobacter sp.]